MIATNPISPLHPPHSIECHPERSEGSDFDFSPPCVSPNVDALDAASTLTPLFAALTKNTRGGGTQASAKNSNCNPIFDLQRSFRESPYQYQSTAFTLPLFSYSYALFCVVRNAISNRFISFHALSAKHPGVGTPPLPPRVPVRLALHYWLDAQHHGARYKLDGAAALDR